jgi:outer membrane protein assembly factor BamD (BamD/ComL family)
VKKILIIGVALAVAIGVFFPEISRFGSTYAFKPENQQKNWAPGMALNVANINMRFFRFKSAHEIYLKYRSTWPTAPKQDDVDYKVAVCLEKDGQLTQAIAAYEAFKSKYPDHRWHGQAAKRIENIKANME